jgi:hypothetical protein
VTTIQASLAEARSPLGAQRAPAIAEAARTYMLLAITESLTGAVAALMPAEGTGGSLEVTRLRARVAELETENADLIRAAGLGLE